jgi:hypothetical protein
MDPLVIPIVVTPAFFALIGWVTWVIVETRRKQNTAKAQAEVQTKFLDKLGSSRELIDFSESEGGKKFMETLGIEKAGMGPLEVKLRLLSSIQKGLILTLIGGGGIYLDYRFASYSGGIFLTTGIFALAIGVGFLVSTLVSFRLSKQWGLMDSGASNRK